ncbi:MAG: ABC transporter substrate-binding protein [Acidobacteriota bacterium]
MSKQGREKSEKLSVARSLFSARLRRLCVSAVFTPFAAHALTRRLKTIILILSFLILVAIPSLSHLSSLPQGRQLTVEERCGQQIYRRGISPSGKEIKAIIGDSSDPLPASAFACANCHARDGAGKPEGGVIPSNLTWDALTRPYVVTAQGGRKRLPYTERLLKRAITLGVDSSGNRLHPAMPRYQMSQEDAADLIAYLKKLGHDLDPGLSDASITIGTIAVRDGRFADMTESVKAALRAYFEDINRQGGLFNRRLSLKIIESSESPAERLKALRQAVESEEVFALTSVFMAGADEEIIALCKTREIPLVGAFTLDPQSDATANPFVFYIHSGLDDEAHALGRFAAEKYAAANPAAVILHTEEKPTRAAAARIKELCAKSNWSAVEVIEAQRDGFNAAETVAHLIAKRVEVIFFLAPNEIQKSFLEKAEPMRPTIFIPGSLAGREIFERRDLQVFLSMTALPSDRSEEGLAEYGRLAREHNLPSRHLASQLSALASARVLVEGLRRSGRDASRQRLIQSLEGLYRFPTGLTSPVTYDANRRIGSRGACIVEVDRKSGKLLAVSERIEPK